LFLHHEETPERRQNGERGVEKDQEGRKGGRAEKKFFPDANKNDREKDLAE